MVRGAVRWSLEARVVGREPVEELDRLAVMVRCIWAVLGPWLWLWGGGEEEGGWGGGWWVGGSLAVTLDVMVDVVVGGTAGIAGAFFGNGGAFWCRGRRVENARVHLSGSCAVFGLRVCVGLVRRRKHCEQVL